MGRPLKKEDILAYAIASTALSTGGGGVGPSVERAGLMYDEAMVRGARPELIKLSEVPDDAIVTSTVGTGGGVQTEMKMRWGSEGGRLTRDSPYPPDPEATKDRILENDAVFSPLNTWSEIPGPAFRASARKRLMEIVGINKIFSDQSSVVSLLLRWHWKSDLAVTQSQGHKHLGKLHGRWYGIENWNIQLLGKPLSHSGHASAS